MKFVRRHEGVLLHEEHRAASTKASAQHLPKRVGQVVEPHCFDDERVEVNNIEKVLRLVIRIENELHIDGLVVKSVH